MVELADLHEGKLYRFRYVQQSGNGQYYEWESQAVYLGHRENFGPELIISYRPKAGTAGMRLEDVLEVRELERHRLVRGDDNVMLPRRKPGAVDPPTSTRR